jgi:hypothetical protein
MPTLLVRAPDVDQARLAEPGGRVVLAFGRRDAASILVAVLVPEEAEVDVAALHLVEVGRLRVLVPRRQLLEQEDLRDVFREQRVAEQERLQIPAQRLELLLHAGDEDAETRRRHRCYGAPIATRSILAAKFPSTFAPKSDSIW